MAWKDLFGKLAGGAEKRGEAPPKSASETWKSYIARTKAAGLEPQYPSEYIREKYEPTPTVKVGEREYPQLEPEWQPSALMELEKRQQEEQAMLLAQQEAAMPIPPEKEIVTLPTALCNPITGSPRITPLTPTLYCFFPISTAIFPLVSIASLSPGNFLYHAISAGSATFIFAFVIAIFLAAALANLGIPYPKAAIPKDSPTTTGASNFSLSPNLAPTSIGCVTA